MTRVDGALVLMVLIWGANYSVIKRAFEEIPAQSFNAIRIILASGVFWLAIRSARRHALAADPSRSTIFYTPNALTSRDRWDLLWLRSASFGGATRAGDLLVMVSVGCWAAYTLGAGRLMARHSPLYVTGMTMAIGAVPYVLLAVPALLRTDWSAARPVTYVMLVLSALLALNVAYLIWYIAVQKIGPARTSVYSNVVPIVAIAFAALLLGETLSREKLLGAAAVLGGVFLTRLKIR
jgi:drug/metabolite transporter (DMT)-like permease